MIILYEPKPEDLWFREQFMSDPDTMSYNHAWGGTIPFPRDKWDGWYDYWLVHHEHKRFYRYLQDSDTEAFIGEAAYHYDEVKAVWLADVIVVSAHRGKGYGSEGLRLLCKAASDDGIDVLRDDIAIDNPAIRMFLKAGFVEEYRTEEYIMLKKELKKIYQENLHQENLHRRIMVIGCPGSGKSTFSRKLRDKTGLPLFYLDMLYHNPDKTTISREDFNEKLSEIVETDEWIIDGNYQRTLPLRFEKCTEVFLFDLPLEQCLEGAASRIGLSREDLPWVENEFDPQFMQHILDFQRDKMPRIMKLIDQYKTGRKITIFHSRQEADDFLSKM